MTIFQILKNKIVEILKSRLFFFLRSFTFFFFIRLFTFFFEFKILSFRQKDSENHKILRQNTLESKLKICRRNCHKNQHLLIFDDFGKIFDFGQFFEAHLWGFKIVGNRQTHIKISGSNLDTSLSVFSYPR